LDGKAADDNPCTMNLNQWLPCLRINGVAVAASLCVAVLSATSASGAESSPLPSDTATIEALGMLHQVVSNVGDCVRRRDLASVHLEDVLLSSAMAAVLQVTKALPPDTQPKFRAELEDFGHQLSELHYVSDLKKQDRAEKQLLLVLQGFGRIKSFFPADTLKAASDAAEHYVCPLHPEVTGRRTASCQKCGRDLEQQMRLIAGRTNGPYCSIQTVQATIAVNHPLTAGHEAGAVLRLKRLDGQPVFPTDLIETHTKRIHLLLIDSGLTDFHHEHPVPTGTPGEYAFRFTPRKPGSYLAWADIRPTPMGLQEYAATIIEAETAGEPLQDRVIKTRVAVDGLVFELVFDQPTLFAAKPIHGRLRVSTSDGNGFNQLEPFMAAFAHLVGFHEDLRSVLHFHPKGRPVLNEKARGGPELEFILYAPQPGFVRLFAQVQVDGVPRFARFGLQFER
jgi:hypothetical protein